MENNTTKSRGSLKALFLIPSIIGVILFMIPVKNADGDWTVVVKIIADIISGAIGGSNQEVLAASCPCCASSS